MVGYCDTGLSASISAWRMNGGVGSIGSPIPKSKMGTPRRARSSLAWSRTTEK